MITQKRRLGNTGEEKTCIYLKKLGYSIIERNYLRKWGEIDIIAEKNHIIYFLEVKTIKGIFYRPEENMSFLKRKKLRKTIEIYLIQNNIQHIPWKFILSSVRVKGQSGEQTDISFIEEIL